MAITAPVRLTAWEHNFVRLRTVQGEDQSRVISADIFERDNVPLDMSGYTASVYILERSGRKVTEPAEISGNTITATIPYLSSPGDAEVQFCLVKSEAEMLKIVGLTLDVQPSDLEDAAEASDEFNDLAAAVAAAQEATTAAQNAAALANQTAEDIEERADSGEFDGASGTIDATTATTLTGLLKGNGSTVSAAAAGVDYATPAQVDAKLDADNYAHLATPLTTGTSKAFVLTLDPPLTAYTPGMVLAVRFHTLVYTGALLNINGLGDKPIRALDGTERTQQMGTGTHLLMYDGTAWVAIDWALPIDGGSLQGSLQPFINSTFDLGSSSNPWRSIYTDNLNVDGSSMPDFVIEQGTSGIWTYRKWKSGIKECWGITATQDIADSDPKWTSWAGAYLYKLWDNNGVQYPTGLFSENPCISVDARLSNCPGYVFMDGGSSIALPGVNVVSLDVARNINVNVHIHAIGR